MCDGGVVYANMNMGVCMHMWKPEEGIGHSSLSIYTGPEDNLSEPGGPTYPPLPVRSKDWGYGSVGNHAGLFMWVLRIQTQQVL